MRSPHPVCCAVLLLLLQFALSAAGAGQTRSTEHGDLQMVAQTPTADAAPIDFSPDGHLLANANELWDVHSRRMLRLLPARGNVYAVSFSLDGALLAGLQSSARGRNAGRELVVWDVSNGNVIRTVPMQEQTPTCLAFRPKTLDAAIGYGNGEIRLWDVQSGQSRLLAKAEATITDLCFDTAGKTLAAGVKEKLLLWDFATGGRQVFQHSGLKSADSVALSPDGTRAAAGNVDGLVLWDTQTGHALGTFPHSRKVCFTSDGQTLLNLRGSYESLDGSLSLGSAIDVLDANTGKRTKTTSRGYLINFLKPVPGGQIVAGPGFGGIELFDPKTGNEVGSFHGSSLRCANIVFSHRGDIVALSAGPSLILWSRQTGRTIRAISLTEKYYVNRSTYNLFFSPNDEIIYVATSDGTRRWRVADGTELPLLAKLSPSPTQSPDYYSVTYNAALMSPDGKRVMGIRTLRKTARETDESLVCSKIDVWNTASDAKLITFGDDKWTVTKGLDEKPIWGAALRPDSGEIATNRLGADSVQIWNTDTGQLQVTFDPGLGPVTSLAYSPNGKLLAVGSESGQVNVYTELHGKPLFELRGHSGEVTSLAFTPDGARLLSASAEKVIAWNTTSGLEQFHMDQSNDPVQDLAVSADGLLCATAGYTGTTRMWNLDTGASFLSLNASTGGEIVCATPDGYYMGEPTALNAVAFRTAGRAFPFEQFDLQLNRPDRVLSALRCKDPSLIEAYHRAYSKRLTRSGYDESQLAATLHVPELKITTPSLPLTVPTRQFSFAILAEEADPGLFLDRLSVSVNDIPTEGTVMPSESSDGPARLFSGLQGYPLRDRKRHRFTASVTLLLSEGSNKVQISCLNSQGVESLKQTFYITYTSPSPTIPALYIATVGVSEYADDRFRLRYADKDARDLLQYFKDHAGRFSEVHTLALTNPDATRQNILAKVQEFLRPARHEDYIVLFFAGHGVLDHKQDYYFGTCDIRFDAPAYNGLSYDAIDGLLAGTRAPQAPVDGHVPLGRGG